MGAGLDHDGDGVPSSKDDYPNNVAKVKDLPDAFSSLSGNLKLWLDASDATAVEKDASNNISQWYDWSGNGNHANAYDGTPEFKTNLGINSIYFDGGDSLKLDSLPQVLGMTNENVDGYEIYMAINHENTGPGFVLAAGLAHHEIHVQGTVEGDGIRFIPNYSPPYVDKGGNIKNETILLNARVENETGYIAVDGQQSNVTKSGALSSNNDTLYIGRRTTTEAYKYNGHISEVLIFDKALTSEDRVKINAYLSEKWGLQSTVDSDDDGVVDANDSDHNTQVLSQFAVPSNRTLTLTDTEGNSHSLDYVAGSSETLNFSDFGIQVDLDSTYAPSSGLDGTNIEIAASRDLQVGADNDANHQLQLGISSVTASGLRIDGSQVVDIDQARAAITSLDNATDMVNQERSYLGSMQNRLAFTMSNLTSQTQNIEAARSSIQDTDFAADAADLAKHQILAQSATAMLAQASAISQNILSLIAA